jgi:hypothetical protein
MFRSSDQRRVQSALDDALPAPYEAQVTIENGRLMLKACVMDPDNAAMPVVQAFWTYSPGYRTKKQPEDAEILEIAAGFVTACDAYTAAQEP